MSNLIKYLSFIEAREYVRSQKIQELGKNGQMVH